MKKCLLLKLLLLILACVALQAISPAAAHAQGIIALEAGVFHDVDRPADSDIGPAPYTGLQLGYEIAENFQLELSLGYAFYDFDATLSGESITLSEEVFRTLFGLKYIFSGRNLSPWLYAALGHTWVHTRDKTVQIQNNEYFLTQHRVEEFSAALGAGVNYKINPRWSAVFSAIFTTVTNEGDNFQFNTYSGGLAYAY